MTSRGHSHQNLSTRSLTHSRSRQGKVRPIAKSFGFRALYDVDGTALLTKAATSLFLTKNSAAPTTTKATRATRNLKNVDSSKMPSALNRAADWFRTRPQSTIARASHLSLWLHFKGETDRSELVDGSIHKFSRPARVSPRSASPAPGMS